MNIYEGGCPCRLQACWWLTKPMWDRQIQPQWLQLKVWSDMAAEAPWIFLLWCFSLRLALWESSKVERTWWMVQCQAWQSAASVDHWWWSMWQVLWVFLRESLKRFFGAPLCHSSQWRVHHTGLSWAGNGHPFWRHALPIIAVTSAT